MLGITDDNVVVTQGFQGMMRASIQAVAAEAGVSVSTVSRTFTKPDLVLPETRAKVEAAARKLDFQISRSAAALKSGQTMRVALLSGGNIASWFNANVFAGLDSILHPAGYDIAVYAMSTAEQRRDFFTSLPVRRNVDAVIACSFNLDPDEVRRLSHMKVPIIGVNIPSTEGFDATVSIDDEQAMHMIADHLRSLGHRHIAYAGTASDPSSNMRFSADARLQGLMSACSAEPALRLDSIIIDDENPVNAVMNRLISTNTAPTALCCQSDDLALPLLYRLKQYGRDVPQSLSLVGFDDIPMSQQVGLTTIRQNPYGLGEYAAQQVLSCISGTMNDDERHSTYPVQLMLRETTMLLR